MAVVRSISGQYWPIIKNQISSHDGPIPIPQTQWLTTNTCNLFDFVGVKSVTFIEQHHGISDAALQKYQGQTVSININTWASFEDRKNPKGRPMVDA